ncbi:MAG: NRDE family protein [Rhodospirillaceae bacterium]|nr:NRDE family protein [Rhodospirillaceae bacterium]
MCTVVILRRPGHRWPLVLGANRDEQMTRPWKAPGRHWPDRPEVIAGLDELSGGSWMGVNDFGVVACILNRRGTLGPQEGKLSRGEIVLDALDHPDAILASEALKHLDGRAFRDFNLVIADNRDAYWLKLDSSASDTVSVTEIPEGLSMVTAGDMNDDKSPRIAAFWPLFNKANVPDPDQDDWAAWKTVLAAGPMPVSSSVAMCFHTDTGFGTSSSTLLALPAIEAAMAYPPQRLNWLFAEGPPDSAPFEPVAL